MPRPLLRPPVITPYPISMAEETSGHPGDRPQEPRVSQLLLLPAEGCIVSALQSLLVKPASSAIRVGGNADTQILCLLRIKESNVSQPKEL